MLEPFVDATWLAAHRDHVVLADVRFYLDGRSGRGAYERGHLPGAVYVELDEVLSGPAGDGADGRHPLPSPERFAAGLRDHLAPGGQCLLLLTSTADEPALLRSFEQQGFSVEVAARRDARVEIQSVYRLVPRDSPR